MSSPNLPERRTLDRLAVERVLARAAELQASGSGDAPAEQLSEAQLLELGKEVGLSPEYLRQAIAEERTRIVTAEPEGNAVARAVGPAGAAASRTVRGSAAQVLKQLDGWMQREECLRPLRRFEDRVVWEPRTDLVTSLRRNLDFGGRGYLLSKAQTVAATAVPVDDARCIVHIEADFSQSRRAVLTTTAVATTGAAGASAVALVMGFFAPVVIVPAVGLSAAAWFAARRNHGRTLARAQLMIEQILDHLERGELGRPSLIDSLANRL